MMDLKEIIKWFIPCFHILLTYKRKPVKMHLTFVCLFLLFNSRPTFETNTSSDSDLVINNNMEKDLNLVTNKEDIFNHRESTNRTIRMISTIRSNEEAQKGSNDIATGRTFGRPFKKMAAALIPLVFQMGAAATWAVVAALVGIKTLGVTLIILKLLLVAGAAKIGALFGSKGHHHSSGWEQPHSPQKEIHLHIHNGNHGHSAPDEHIPFSSWSRDGVTAQPENKHVNVVYEPYVMPGPQTISTPYGNYVKIDNGNTAHTK